jgi:hypothetical protein
MLIGSADGAMDKILFSLEQFQEKCEAVFRSELRENKETEWFDVSEKR